MTGSATRIFVLIAFLLAASGAVAQTPASVTIGVVPSIPAGATYIAVEKGYFRDAGIAVTLENVVSASAAISLLATDRVQVIEGGISAGYWNALARGMPVIMALERGTGPLYHDMLLRKELVGTVNQVADLKGRRVALVAPGSSQVYQLAKLLDTAGLTLKDVAVKYIPFTQMGPALVNGAVDAAIEVPPFGEIMVAQGMGAKWIDPEDYIEPKPVSFVGFMANTDWIARDPDLAKRFFLALVRGARDFCQAYHNGPNRAEIEDIFWKFHASDDRALIHTMAWQARDPNGRFNRASVEDFQTWFLKLGLIDQKFPMDRLIDTRFSDYAAQQLPPFEVVNKASKLEGCR